MKKIILIPFLLLLLYNFSFTQRIPEVTLLEAFMDGAIEANMDDLHINGVTVSVVSGDSLYWSKGYGYSDSENNIKVDPATSLFRMGSVSKLFVWTAVMQLYEDGLLDLDADVTTYIKDFTIPDNYKEPITMKHLLSHTPGFEDYYFNLFSTDSLPPASLADELNLHMPGRVRPPGVHSSYSNHGTGIAAYIVEQLSGMNWDDYVEQKIFQPLGMDLITFRQPLPEKFKSIHSQGYTYGNGKHTSKSLKTIPLAPVGVATTTAEEMIPFMAAYINNGNYNGFQLLDSATVALMHSTLSTHDENIRGMCHGFFDLSQNGYKIVGHGGATEYFFSYLKLLPEEDYGIFISTNTEGGTSLIRNVTNQFIDRYFPDKTTKPDAVELTEEELNKFAGNYLSNRRPINRLTKIIGLLNEPTVVAVDNNQLKTIGSSTKFWYPVSDHVFRNTESTDLISFEKGEDGNAQYLYFDSNPHTALERISLIQSRNLNMVVFFGGIALGIIAILLWITSFIFRRKYKVVSKNNLPLVSKIVASANTIVSLVFLFLLSSHMADGEFVFRPTNGYDYFVMTFPIIIGILSLFQLFLAFTHWGSAIKIRSKIFYSLITLFMVGITLLMYYWNLIGYKF